MSPASVVAPSKCHRSRRYMAAMQGCVKGKKKKKNTANLLDISCKLTVKKLPLSFTIIILRNGCSRFMPGDRYMCRSAMLRERGRDKKKKKKRGDVREGWNCVWANQQREAEDSLSFSLDLSACACVRVCVRGFGCMCATQSAWACFECVKTVQPSHPARIAPGLYPSNCRSQSDIVLLWLLSMVLHISPEMTKSLSQCPWPPASLLVLLHSHPLMWPWIGIGHRPHSRDWYRLCCSHAYRSSELGRSAGVCLIVCLCILSPLERLKKRVEL